MGKLFFFGPLLALVLLFGNSASLADPAEKYPNKQIRIIVPEVPKSSTDLVAEIVAARLTKTLGQQVTVDHISNTAALEAGAKAEADGYTIIFAGQNTVTVAPHLYKDLAYDPFRDFRPVSFVATMPFVLAVNPSVKANTVKDFIAAAKSKPDDFKMGAAGAGTGSHLAGLLFEKAASLKTPIVFYKGGGPTVAAIVDNQSQWFITPLPSAMAEIKAGKLKALGVTGTARSPALPGVPVVAQAVPGYSQLFWGGLIVPKKTPSAIVRKLNTAIARSLSGAEVKDQFLALGAESKTSTPDDFGKFLRAEYQRMGTAVQLAGIVPKDQKN
jgi:tripartite-type tricarboxylate transporter receptor subunit TctC